MVTMSQLEGFNGLECLFQNAESSMIKDAVPWTCNEMLYTVHIESFVDYHPYHVPGLFPCPDLDHRREIHPHAPDPVDRGLNETDHSMSSFRLILTIIQT